MIFNFGHLECQRIIMEQDVLSCFSQVYDFVWPSERCNDPKVGGLERTRNGSNDLKSMVYESRRPKKENSASVILLSVQAVDGTAFSQTVHFSSNSFR